MQNKFDKSALKKIADINKDFFKCFFKLVKKENEPIDARLILVYKYLSLKVDYAVGVITDEQFKQGIERLCTK